MNDKELGALFFFLLSDAENTFEHSNKTDKQQ